MKECYKVNLIKTYFFCQKRKACISVSVRPGFHLTGAQLENKDNDPHPHLMSKQSRLLKCHKVKTS